MELIDITKFGVSSFEMLCQICPAPTFSCHLFVGIFGSRLMARLGESLCHWRIFNFCSPRRTIFLGSFCLHTLNHCWQFFSILLNVSRDYGLIHLILLLLPAVTSSVNNSEPFPLAATNAPVSTMFDRLCDVLWIQTFPFSSFWYKFILVLSAERMLLENWAGYVRFLKAHSNPAFPKMSKILSFVTPNIILTVTLFIVNPKW